ncbi:hypothetical protein [Bacillus sp. FJAT-27445]|uniref:hypothetical protein n=1 Tax=Bacillus sp. FJAT-27445 TaxID=1679166 RepID=UPI0007436F1B|nr:hypothetical protein [Bacillus sp. FJAT-27445]
MKIAVRTIIIIGMLFFALKGMIVILTFIPQNVLVGIFALLILCAALIALTKLLLFRLKNPHWKLALLSFITIFLPYGGANFILIFLKVTFKMPQLAENIYFYLLITMVFNFIFLFVFLKQDTLLEYFKVALIVSISFYTIFYLDPPMEIKKLAMGVFASSLITLAIVEWVLQAKRQ